MNFLPLKKGLSPSHIRNALFSLSLVASTVAQAVTVGEPAPFFELKGMKNNTHNLNEFQNKVVLVNFWASWCSPCRKELPLLDELQAKHKDLKVIAINIDSDVEVAVEFIKEHKIKSLVLFDASTEIVGKYGAMAMPTSYVLDKQGIVRYLHYGFKADKDPSKWEVEVANLLGENK